MLWIEWSTLYLYFHISMAYPLKPHLQSPFQGAQLNQLQQDFNTKLSQVWISLEWLV